MKIDFSGAAGSVTGSSHLFEVNGRKVLVDCGLYQGRDAREKSNDSFLFNPGEIDFLLVSHAHIDHTGRIPMLYKKGFRGKIICTPPTKDLCNIMLLDSAYIQEQDADRENRKRARKGELPIDPIYTVKDAEKVLKQFETREYNELFELYPGLKVRFSDSGHMLGSSFVELFIHEDGKDPIKVTFSSDLGNHNIPLVPEPTTIDETDILLLESTYGNRLHEPQADENDKLIAIINETVNKGGNVIIPSFAVGRTQEIIYILNHYAELGTLDPKVKVIIDSPLASKATEVFRKYISYMDEETQEYVKRGDDVFEFKGLDFTESVDDSKALNTTQSGMVIISASGMAEAGRIRHHLKHNLWRPECAVVFVGYQAEQTLGRILLDGAKEVRIMGEDVQVNAPIYSLNGLSGHADKNGLMEWTGKFKVGPKKIFLVHGDEDARNSLQAALAERGYNVESAVYGEKVEINSLAEIADPKETMMVTHEEISKIGVDEIKKGTLLRKKTFFDGIEYKPESGDLKQKLISNLNKMDVNNLPKEEILKQLAKLIYENN